MKRFFAALSFTFSILAIQKISAQDQFVPLAKDTIRAKQYQPISGAGYKVSGEGFGGWRSGTDGVRYQGDHPRPEYNLDFKGMAKGTAVEKGLLPPIKPAVELHLRDGVVTLGGDGNYYLTGSSGTIFGPIRQEWNYGNLKI